MEVLIFPLLVAGGGGGYMLACRLFPFAACLKCHGDGKKRSPSGKAWRPCKRCAGSGKRLRVGTRALNAYRRTTGSAKAGAK